MLRKFNVTVETLSTAGATIEARTPEEAIEIAKRMAMTGDLVDEVPEYDWPTVKVDEVDRRRDAKGSVEQ